MNKELRHQMEVDMKLFLKNIEEVFYQDKIEMLKNLIEKYVHLNSCDHKLDYFDLKNIIGSAKSKISNEKLPIYIGEKKKPVSQSDLPHLVFIEATISYLNKEGCLKKIPKFDKREL